MEEPAGASGAEHDGVGRYGAGLSGMGVQDHQTACRGPRLCWSGTCSTILCGGVFDFCLLVRSLGLVQDQICYVPFLGESHSHLYALLPERVEDLMANAVCGISRPFYRFPAEFRRVTAELALGDTAVFTPGEGHPLMFQASHRLLGLSGQYLYGVLIGEPITTLDGVVVMPVPIVLFLIAQAGCDATLGRSGVRPERLQF